MNADERRSGNAVGANNGSPLQMNNPQKRVFSLEVQAVIDDFLPVIKRWEVGRYAISIGGSQGKGTWDHRSDVDFRLFHEKDLPGSEVQPDVWADYSRLVPLCAEA